MLTPFYRTHQYLLEHTCALVRRALMDEIDWNARLIGIKGSRGVGKTTFLLQYAQEYFGAQDRRCLYVNMNNFYFHGHSLSDFARLFYDNGGRVLLIDQVFKISGWSHQLRTIYETLPHLHIIFTGSSVMRLKQENPELNGLVSSYNLRGFSFREYLNLKTGLNLRPYNMGEIVNRHERIADVVLKQVDPMEHFAHYLHHGYYPFFLEQTNFSENLLKVMNMMVEVDILFIKQIELKYLDRIKKLLYLIATSTSSTLSVSRLADETSTSRATVMNYIKYLSDARLINMVYRVGENFPRKPSRLLMHNSNLMHAIMPGQVDPQTMYETFFQNALWGRYDVRVGDRSCTFRVDDTFRCRICMEPPVRKASDVIYALSGLKEGRGAEIPLWLFGFLY